MHPSKIIQVLSFTARNTPALGFKRSLQIGKSIRNGAIDEYYVGSQFGLQLSLDARRHDPQCTGKGMIPKDAKAGRPALQSQVRHVCHLMVERSEFALRLPHESRFPSRVGTHDPNRKTHRTASLS